MAAITTTPKRPGRPRKQADTEDHQIGQDSPREMPTTGPARIEAAVIEPVDGPINKNFLDELAFMEEKIEIVVHETTDKNAPFIVETWCNGRSQFFLRGLPTVVKRKFVAVLARAKKTIYSQENYKDGGGNDAIRNIPHTALQYPFSIVSDANSKGSDWLRKMLAEA